MTGPALHHRPASSVEAMQLVTPRDLHLADLWLRAHGVESAHRHPAVAGRGLLVPAGPGGIFTVARLGQWLVRCLTTGRFEVLDDADFRALHQPPEPAAAR